MMVSRNLENTLERPMHSKYSMQTINSFLKIMFQNDEMPLLKLEKLTREKLTELIDQEVRIENVEITNDLFLLFSSLAIELQKKDIRSEETCTKINECMAKVDLNDNEKAILHMGYFPIMALYHYKLNNYEKSIQYSHLAIQNDDYLLGKYPELFTHKTLQIQNIIKTHLLFNEVDRAFSLCNDMLKYLIDGDQFAYPVGHWTNNFNIEKESEVINVCQTVTIVVKAIITLTKNSEDEQRLFSLAFAGIEGKKIKNPEIKLILQFFEMKFSLYSSQRFDEVQINKWKDKVIESKYISILKPLFSSLFLSMETNSRGIIKRYLFSF